MDVVSITIITLGLLGILVMLGMHLGTSLMLCSFIGVYLAIGSADVAISMMTSAAYTSLKDYTYGVTPLFILMGLLANMSGASDSLYESIYTSMRRLRGSLGYATIISNAIFAAITGVSIASAAVFTKIAVPQMRRLGYDKRFAVGCVAGSSILGMLIPPSVLMIIYGTVSGASIGNLFIGGIIPGIIMTIAFMLVVFITIRLKPEIVPDNIVTEQLTKQERIKIIMKPWSMILLILLSLGGIWLGFFTPTEAGGVAAFGALLLVLINRKFEAKGFISVLANAGVSTGSVMFLLISAQMYSRALAMSGVINLIEGIVLSINLPPICIILLFMLVFLVLGCILDSTSIVLLCVPVMSPIVTSLGYDLTWFGIAAIIAIEVGIISPPFGMSVFTVKSSLGDIGSKDGDDISVNDIFAGALPYIGAMLLVLALIIMFPSLVTCLL